MFSCNKQLSSAFLVMFPLPLLSVEGQLTACFKNALGELEFVVATES